MAVFPFFVVVKISTSSGTPGTKTLFICCRFSIITPYKSRLRFEDIKELAEQIEKPPQHIKVDALWNVYAALEKSKVKSVNAPHITSDAQPKRTCCLGFADC